MKKIKFVLTTILALFLLTVHGQNLSIEDIEVKWTESPNPGRIRVTYVKNNSDVNVRVRFTNEYDNHKQSRDLRPGEERSFDMTCNLIEVKNLNRNNDFIQLFWREKKEKKPVVPGPIPPTPDNEDEDEDKDEDKPKVEDTQDDNKRSLSIDDIIPDFINYIETIPTFSISSIEKDTTAISEHVTNLKNWKNKDEYIKEHRLNTYIKDCNDSINQYTQNVQSLITDYLDKFVGREIENEKECRDSLQNVLSGRLKQRKISIKRLTDEISNSQAEESINWEKLDWKIIGIGSGLFLLIIILFVCFGKANKKKRSTTLSNNEPNGATDDSSTIVVRRKTTSILRKQSLEDVIDNAAYLEIDCNEFCEDSAVRKMYIKNTCIKDIYNMYAEDLRNPNNPKEDGCMVLGRWVHDAVNNEYHVSLEHIVLPGDDAVFAEYELNFGGKIKLRVTEKLRRLRRETNLQYDLTCWVHSHPGLGVFFSNSDSNVQMQLKHPTHPNFLTAIVVDILTPQQEFGIFTFKRDSSISTKADLKKMYSLEELYKWAIESDRNSYKTEDCYNALSNAPKNDDNCYSIELSNGAIIDMGKITTEESVGFVGMVHGFANHQGLKTENVAVTVTKKESVPDNELVGCFIMATHCSIPSIRKAIAGYINKIKFVLVYTSADGLLTSIPIINQDICTDENYYGEQKLEELKIWTRRKR